MTTLELSQKEWVFAPLNENLQAEIASSLRISPILSQILVNRGVVDVKSANAFLQPKLNSLSDPMLLPDIEKSSKRILEAINKDEKITVYGDYDVDGISATALMVQCLEVLSRLYGKMKSGGPPNGRKKPFRWECSNPNISYYIPDRLVEGYGLNAKAIEELSKTGTKVIITVDCGISSFEEARVAKEHGIDLIITDHHEPAQPGQGSPEGRFPGKQADAYAQFCEDAFGLINPKLSTSDYPFKELSGVGIAFMLAWALGQSASNLAGDQDIRKGNKKVADEFKDFLMNAMGLVALGTIADVVPLREENRILVKYGLSSLQNSEHPGIEALKEIANLKDKVITAYHVGFCLGPRINAVGRIGNARKGVEMLTVSCGEKAKEIAEYMENENKKRQKIQSDILESAKKKVLNDIDLSSELSIIISDDSWHQGVVGIVASRLAGEFHRPTIVIATDDEIGHGSARSIPNFHIYNALTKCQEFFSDRKMLISYGGHAQAAGLKIFKKDISEFKKIFNGIISEEMEKENLSPMLKVDAEIKLSSISKSLLEELNRLAPHGKGNAVPVFAAREVSVVGQVRRFGVSGNHLSFYVRQGDISFKAVAFGMGEKSEMLKESNGNCSIAFVLRDPLQTNNFRTSGRNSSYRESLELEIKDIST